MSCGAVVDLVQGCYRSRSWHCASQPNRRNGGCLDYDPTMWSNKLSCGLCCLYIELMGRVVVELEVHLWFVLR